MYTFPGHVPIKSLASKLASNKKTSTPAVKRKSTAVAARSNPSQDLEMDLVDDENEQDGMDTDARKQATPKPRPVPRKRRKKVVETESEESPESDGGAMAYDYIDAELLEEDYI